MLTLLEINFTPFVPTTLLGLLALIAGYLYFYFKSKDDNRVKRIALLKESQRGAALDKEINDLGITIDTRPLSPEQKFELVKRFLRAKTEKRLITSGTTIVLAIIIAVLLYPRRDPYPPDKLDPPLVVTPPAHKYTFTSGFGDIDSPVLERMKQDSAFFKKIGDSCIIRLITEPGGEPVVANQSAAGFSYFYNAEEIKISVNSQTPMTIGLTVPKTAVVKGKAPAKKEYLAHYHQYLKDSLDQVYHAIKKNIHI